MIKIIGIVLPIFLTIGLVAAAITVTFFSFIITAQAELNGFSEKIELLSSSTIKEDDKDNNPDQSIIKQDKDTLYENFTVYEGLGVKLDNSNNWIIHAKSDKSSCVNINLCFLHLGIVNTTEDMLQLWIIQDNLESQAIAEYCKCNTLEDYVKYFYNMISQFDNFSLINENHTTFSSEDKSAIQIEYEFSAGNTKIHAFTVFTKANDSFYQFSSYGDLESFPTYLTDSRKIIDSVEFSPQK